MRVKNVYLKGFKGIVEITTTLKNGVFYICGQNASGKSSFLDGIIYALLGKKAFKRGTWEKVLSHTDDTPLVRISLVDENGEEMMTIERKVNKAGNETLKITKPDGGRLTQDDIDKILEPICLNPVEFIKMPPLKQAEWLGLDTSAIDGEYKSVFSERTFVTRDLKSAAGASTELSCDEPDMEEADLKELYDIKRQIENKNRDRALLQANKVMLEEKIMAMEAELVHVNTEIEALPPEQSVDDIEERIEKANSSQELITKWKEYQKALIREENSQKQHDALTAKLGELKQKKIDYIAGSPLPFPSLTTDAEGGLAVKKDGEVMPLSEDYFSTGELLGITIKLLAKRQPDLRTVIIKEATLLDDEKVASIVAAAKKFDLQVLMEYVGSVDQDSITLVEGELDESDGDKRDSQQ